MSQGIVSYIFYSIGKIFLSSILLLVVLLVYKKKVSTLIILHFMFSKELINQSVRIVDITDLNSIVLFIIPNSFNDLFL